MIRTFQNHESGNKLQYMISWENLEKDAGSQPQNDMINKLNANYGL